MGLFYYITPVELASLIISLCAVVFTIYESRQNQKHNMLSVKPILRFDITRGTDIPCSLNLCNEGLGPAIIDSYNIYVDGKELKHMDGDNTLQTALIMVGIDIDMYGALQISPGNAIGSEKTCFIIEEGKPHSDTITKRLSFFNSIHRIKIKIRYHSIYQEYDEVVFRLSNNNDVPPTVDD